MMRRTMLAVILALAFGAVAPAGAQEVSEATSDGRFRFEWEITTSRNGPRLDAYLYNLTVHPVVYVQVQVEQLDDAGTVVRRSTTHVWSDVAAGSRTFFQVPGVSSGVRYRLSVVNYDLQSGG